MKSVHSLCAMALLGACAMAQPQYTVVVLSQLPGASSTVPKGLNHLGDVVGWSTIGGGPRAFLKKNNQPMINLGTLPGASSSIAYAVNNLSHVVGESGGRAFRHVPGTGMQDLTGGLPSRANAINDVRQVAGTLDPNNFLGFTPFRYEDGPGMVPLAPGLQGRALDINASGQIAGYLSGQGAFRYDPGQGLQMIPSYAGYLYMFGFAINNAGDVAGTMTTGSFVHLFRFTDATGVQDLGSLGQLSSVRGINVQGWIVGTRTIGVDHGFLYTPQGGIQDLNNLIPSGPFYVTDAMDINDSGQISALAFDNSLPGSVAVRLDPVAPRAAVTPLGSGCGAGPASLSATPPVLGQLLVFTVTGATPLSPAYVFGSIGGPVRAPLGSGCESWVDLSQLLPLGAATTDPSGGASIPLPVPPLPALSLVPATVQGVATGSPAPLGIDVTNGLLLLLGG